MTMVYDASDKSLASSPSLCSSTDEGTITVSLGTILTSALNALKVEDASIRKKAVEFIGSLSLATINTYGRQITALKAIADACAVNSKLFSQSEICDFLTIAVKAIDPKNSNSKAVNDATFHIYVDIMEHYVAIDNNLKMHYPRLIVDTISALEKGVDTRGRAVGIYSIDRYYRERKQTVTQEDPAAGYVLQTINEKRPSFTSSALTESYTDELVENLMQMTSRPRNDLEHSLATLHPIDIKKITDLSFNYKRLQKYNGLLSTPEIFKCEVEKELGRRLTDNQLQHAINSIRKSKTYIENILDGRFAPHGTHGINHVKHNLEYGYQLMGLMEPRKRRSN
jgi:hypothetical protein